jgi:hypothetical protein
VLNSMTMVVYERSKRESKRTSAEKSVDTTSVLQSTPKVGGNLCHTDGSKTHSYQKLSKLLNMPNPAATVCSTRNS